MKLIGNVLFKKRRDRIATRKKTLDEICHHLNEFSCKNIAFGECLVKTGILSTELIVNHYTDAKAPKNIHDLILIMFTNYYVILHTDNYSGNRTIHKEYISHQVAEICEIAIGEMAKNRKFKLYDVHTANSKSSDFTKQLVDVYYITGVEGCLKYLSFAIYSALQSADKNQPLSKNRIENVIRSIEADKFLNLLH